MQKKYDYLIVGCGVIGLAIGLTIKRQRPGLSVLIIDKEDKEAFHASSRNSGVLHAGFYYSADSLKARLTVAGSKMMKEYCRQKGLPVNNCGKLVVATNEDEVATLHELEKRGKSNGSNVALISSEQAKLIDPNVKTHKLALHSPDTASIDPKAVCRQMKDDLVKQQVEFLFNTRYLSHQSNTIITSNGEFAAGHLINCAGLYADKIAHDFGFGREFTMIPFKGLYLKYTKNKTDVRTNIYPVPNLRNPFLGVHFTKTVDGTIKIGPTAIPALWRENYQGTSGFNAGEFTEIIWQEAMMFITNKNSFRHLAFEELRKYNKKSFIQMAQKLVESIDPAGFTEYTAPGIRAQLARKKDLQLVQDFLIEGDAKCTHILNAVSPAFSCAFSFAELVAKERLI